ncbi:MAG TPA: hypothetical protein VGN51_00065 [Acidimicrobiia bacterium]|jgi:hypothetical protein
MNDVMKPGLGAAAGAFVVVGVVSFAVEVTSDDPTTPGVVLGGVRGR